MHVLPCWQLLNSHWPDQQLHMLPMPSWNVRCSRSHCPVHALPIRNILWCFWREQRHHMPKLPAWKLLYAALWRKPVVHQLLCWHVLVG